VTKGRGEGEKKESHSALALICLCGGAGTPCDRDIIPRYGTKKGGLVENRTLDAKKKGRRASISYFLKIVAQLDYLDHAKRAEKSTKKVTTSFLEGKEGKERERKRKGSHNSAATALGGLWLSGRKKGEKERLKKSARLPREKKGVKRPLFWPSTLEESNS